MKEGYDIFIKKPELLASFLESLQGQDARLIDWAEIDLRIQKILGFNTEVKNIWLNSFMTPLVKAADKDKISWLFDDDFVSGTFMVGERFDTQSFLFGNDRLNIRKWIHKEVKSELQRIVKMEGKTGRMFNFDNIKTYTEQEIGLPLEDIVFIMLFLTFPDGIRFMDKIPNQIYQDVFLRVISRIIWRHPYAYPHSDDEYNAKIEAISFKILPRISDLSLKELYSYSIAAGGLGIDMKSQASSVIDKTADNIIPYYYGEETEIERLERMFDKLSERAKRGLAIDSWSEFEQQIINSDKEIQLVWFHDDCAETIFDLLFFQKLLQTNPRLKIVSITRSGEHGQRFGNDSSSIDILKYLSNPALAPLMRIMVEEGRYSFSHKGPCWGAAVGPELSDEAIEYILGSEAVVVKGARSCEMLSGIKKDTYFAFMVCREYSETVTGVGAETGLSVFLKQEGGLPLFQGFKERHTRKQQLLGTKRKGNICLMTAAEHIEAIRSDEYKQIIDSFKGDKLQANTRIKEESERLGITISDFIKGIRVKYILKPHQIPESINRDINFAI
ncbi:MAG: hypothetical protein KKD11_02600 [Candidatus Omnitrophica bacterium]|nr:hypothetical protein [Candidatus Omnitrophota bacterium]